MRFLSAGCLLGAALVMARSAPPEPAPPPNAPDARKYAVRESDKITNTDPIDTPPTNNRRKTYELKVTAGRRYVVSASVPNFSYTAVVRVEDSAGRVVAGVSPISRLEFTPAADAVHRVVVTTSAPATGPFVLRVWEAATAVEKDDTLTPEDPLDRSPTFSPSRRYEEKMLAGEVRVLRLTSNSFDPRLRVENDRGEEVATSRGRRDGTAAQVVLTPAKDGAQSAIVKADGFSTGGAFAFSVLRPAGKSGPASFDTEGAIGPADPFDRVLSRNRRKAFEEKLDAGAAYVYELSSAAFQPHLRVEAEDGTVLAEDADARLVRLPVMPAAGGAHRVVVTARRADTFGAFALRRFVTDTRAETVRVADKIGANDPFHLEPTDKYVRSTRLKLAAGSRYVVDVKSDVFTPALHLEGPAGRLVAGAEGGVGAAGAQLSFAPPATGEYTLHVTSTSDARDGPFRRRVFSGEAAPKDGFRQEGTLTAKDPLDAVTTGRRHKSFPVKLTYGRLYEVAVDSEAVDSFVYLTDASGRVVAEDDNGGAGTNALLRFAPPRSDAYTVVVTSATPDEAGKFAVKVTEPFSKAAPVLDASGELTAKDPVFAVPTQARAKIVTHKMEAGKAYLVRLESGDFAPHLRVEDEAGKPLAQAAAVGRSAAVVFECPRAGTYRLVATTTRAGATGAFVLTADALAPGETVADRLDSGERFRLPTDVRQKELTVELKAGTRYLVQVEGLRGATLAVQPVGSDPALVRASASSVVDFSPPIDGKYRVSVFSRATGPFTVLARPLIAQPERAGKLETSDPGDVLTTDRRCKTHTHRLSAGRLYLLRAESADFEPLVRVLDGSGAEVGRAGEAGSQAAQATFTPPADGEYTVVTTSVAAGRTGRFRTRLDPLVSVTEKKETLTAADPFDALPATDGRTQKVYETRLEAKSLYTFGLTSSAFDARLRLTDAQGKEIASEQLTYAAEKGGRLESGITFPPPTAGVYRVAVTSRGTVGTGAFKLRTRRHALVLGKDESLLATDPLDRAPSGRFHKRYKAQLEGGTPYTIQMTGEKFSPMVRIEDATGKELGRFDPAFGEGAKPLQRLFVPEMGGEFTFFVTTQYPRSVGAFTFSVSTAAPTKQIGGRLTAEDNFDPLSNESYQAAHTLDLKAGRDYVIGLESADFVPQVRLESDRGRHLVRYAPITRKGSTYLTYTPTRDERVRVIVTTPDAGKTGGYRLTVRE